MSSDQLRRFLSERQGEAGDEADQILDRIPQIRYRNHIGVEDFHHYLFDVKLNPPIRSQALGFQLPTVIADGPDFPANVENGTTLMGWPNTDLPSSIETAGDINQIQSKIDIVWTQFGVRGKGISMPKKIELVNDGFKCPKPTNKGGYMSACCIKDPKLKRKKVLPVKFLPRRYGDLNMRFKIYVYFPIQALVDDPEDGFVREGHPFETQFLIVEGNDGSHSGGEDEQIIYTVFLPILEGDFRAVLQGDPVVDRFEGTHLVFVAAGQNPFDVITNAVKNVEGHLQTFSHRERKKIITLPRCTF